jgi:hypothetical protein
MVQKQLYRETTQIARVPLKLEQDIYIYIYIYIVGHL